MLQENSEIQDIITPDQVSFWPPQPGWYAVCIVLILVLVFLIIKIIQNKKRNAYRHSAILTIDNIPENTAIEATIMEINTILKACALKAFPRDKIANLSGKVWIEFLIKSSKNIHFNDIHKKMLSIGPYQKISQTAYRPEDVSGFIAISKQWIKTHRKNNSYK